MHALLAGRGHVEQRLHLRRDGAQGACMPPYAARTATKRRPSSPVSPQCTVNAAMLHLGVEQRISKQASFGRAALQCICMLYGIMKFTNAAKRGFEASARMWTSTPASCDYKTTASPIAAQKALLPGDSEVQQLLHTFQLLGTPNEDIWPGLSQLKVRHRDHHTGTLFARCVKDNLLSQVLSWRMVSHLLVTLLCPHHNTHVGVCMRLRVDPAVYFCKCALARAALSLYPPWQHRRRAIQ